MTGFCAAVDKDSVSRFKFPLRNDSQDISFEISLALAFLLFLLWETITQAKTDDFSLVLKWQQVSSGLLDSS